MQNSTSDERVAAKKILRISCALLKQQDCHSLPSNTDF